MGGLGNLFPPKDPALREGGGARKTLACLRKAPCPLCWDVWHLPLSPGGRMGWLRNSAQGALCFLRQQKPPDRAAIGEKGYSKKDRDMAFHRDAKKTGASSPSGPIFCLTGEGSLHPVASRALHAGRWRPLFRGPACMRQVPSCKQDGVQNSRGADLKAQCTQTI